MSKNTIITVLVTSTTSNYFLKLLWLTISSFKEIYSIVSENDASDRIKMRQWDCGGEREGSGLIPRTLGTLGGNNGWLRLFFIRSSRAGGETFSGELNLWCSKGRMEQREKERDVWNRIINWAGNKIRIGTQPETGRTICNVRLRCSCVTSLPNFTLGWILINYWCLANVWILCRKWSFLPQPSPFCFKYLQVDSFINQVLWKKILISVKPTNIICNVSVFVTN